MVEGLAVEPCQSESLLDGQQPVRWAFYFGEAQAAPSGPSWSPVRASAGCASSSSGLRPSRGIAFVVGELTLSMTATSGPEILLEASYTVSRLTGFTGGSPAYETKTQKQTIRAPDGGGTAIPVLIADSKEQDEFGVRELLVRIRTGRIGSRSPVEYGELAVSSDFPRAEILLDGGFVGRTSAEGPLLLSAVRAGVREIVIRDTAAREGRATVRVDKGSRTAVSVNLLEHVPSPQRGLRLMGKNPQGADEFWRVKDGAIVVRIPALEFTMGSPDGFGEPSEHPQHRVRVNGFLMDKTEVTWGQFRRFLTESNRPPPASPIWGTPEAFPASNLTWADANAYCAWAGGRLPTEAEWERAARGSDGRQYPWGNTWEEWRCNTRDGGLHAPAAAGSHPGCVSSTGVLDLTGSVWEWCSDWHDASYYSRSPVENPTGPQTGAVRASRGGGWMEPSFSARSAVRQGIDPGWPNPMRGFRCVVDMPGEGAAK